MGLRWIKAALRPFYRSLRRRGVIRTRAERQLTETGRAFDRFHILSDNENIDTITFRNGQCIFRLTDNRQYYFDPHQRAARMYSVPLTGTFERKETDFLRSIIKQDQVCIDIGACFGWYTVLFSDLVRETGHVHAFEPLSSNYQVLAQNVELNNARNVTLNEIALDESSGERELFLPDIGVSGSFKLHTYDRSYSQLLSETKTLDAYCEDKKIGRIDFIKADVEGAELGVIKGAMETIMRHKPVLMLEIQESSTKLFGYTPTEMFELLRQLGYFAHFISEQGRLEVVRDFSQDLPDHNFIFTQETVAT
jgi:FkbM family methyltransferase